jgi:WD40 repeat protein
MLRQLSRLEGYTGDVDSVAWSPSGKEMASASNDRTVMVRDSKSSEPVF